MLNHPTGLFSGHYNSALRGCWPLKFLHTLQLPKMYFKSYLGRRAASCWALPHISSLILEHGYIDATEMPSGGVTNRRTAYTTTHFFQFLYRGSCCLERTSTRPTLTAY